jgi:hypothetical protein
MSDRSVVWTEISQILARRERTMSDAEWRGMATIWPAELTRPEMTAMVARDELGTPLAIIGAVIDDMVCLVRLAVASSHPARWALHDHLVRTLSDRGVRYLLAEGGGPFGALGFTPDVRHYQHLLGYELRHLAPRTPARPVGSAANPREASFRWKGEAALLAEEAWRNRG